MAVFLTFNVFWILFQNASRRSCFRLVTLYLPVKSRKRLAYEVLITFATHADLLCDVTDTDCRAQNTESISSMCIDADRLCDVTDTDFRAQNTESISSMCVDADLLCDVTDTDSRAQNTESILSMCPDIEMCLLTAQNYNTIRKYTQYSRTKFHSVSHAYQQLLQPKRYQINTYTHIKKIITILQLSRSYVRDFRTPILAYRTKKS